MWTVFGSNPCGGDILVRPHLVGKVWQFRPGLRPVSPQATLKSSNSRWLFKKIQGEEEGNTLGVFFVCMICLNTETDFFLSVNGELNASLSSLSSVNAAEWLVEVKRHWVARLFRGAARVQGLSEDWFWVWFECLKGNTVMQWWLWCFRECLVLDGSCGSYQRFTGHSRPAERNCHNNLPTSLLLGYCEEQVMGDQVPDSALISFIWLFETLEPLTGRVNGKDRRTVTHSAFWGLVYCVWCTFRVCFI